MEQFTLIQTDDRGRSDQIPEGSWAGPENEAGDKAQLALMSPLLPGDGGPMTRVAGGPQELRKVFSTQGPQRDLSLIGLRN